MIEIKLPDHVIKIEYFRRWCIALVNHGKWKKEYVYCRNVEEIPVPGTNSIIGYKFQQLMNLEQVVANNTNPLIIEREISLQTRLEFTINETV